MKTKNKTPRNNYFPEKYIYLFFYLYIFKCSEHWMRIEAIVNKPIHF